MLANYAESDDMGKTKNLNARKLMTIREPKNCAGDRFMTIAEGTAQFYSGLLGR